MDARIYGIVKGCGDLEEQIGRILDVARPQDFAEVMAYLLRKTMNAFKASPSTHRRFLDRMPPEVVGKFAPGLLSFYFGVLKDQKVKAGVREAALDATRYVLEQAPRLDSVSETRIHDFFYFNRRTEFKDIYIACVQRFRTARRVFFVSELVVLGHEVADGDYDEVNERIEEVFSVPLVRRLLGIGKYRNNKEVFDRLVQMYGEGEDVADIIWEIQKRYEVKGGVMELYAANEETTRQILLTNDLKRIERFFGNATCVPLHVDVIGKYLELCSSAEEVLGCGLCKRFDVRGMISGSYDELLEYAFSRLASNPRVVINLMGVEFQPRVEDFILQSLELISRCPDTQKLGQYLAFIKIVVGKGCLRRSTLRKIFDGLVYLDNKDYRVRCMKYEVLGEVFAQYALMDEAIEYIAHLDMAQERERRKCIEAGDEALRRADTRNIDEDNTKVLAAIIWDELVITPEEGELKAVSAILRRIVDATGMFYESRISKSSFILHLVDRHGISGFNETKRRCMDEFFGLLTAITKFRLSKRLLERMLLVSLDYFHIFDVTELIRAIVRNDKYYCLFIFYNLRRSAAKTLSRGVVELLKRLLREAQEL